MTDQEIAAALGSTSRGMVPVGGGCIHDCRRLRLADGRSVFVKIACGDAAPLLLAEASGLTRLAPHIRVPAILGMGDASDGSRWLALEWLILCNKDVESWADLGQQLARLHAVIRDRPGLSRESYIATSRYPYAWTRTRESSRWDSAGNFIGLTPQDNTPAASWREFYIERRLRPQIRLAQSKGHIVPEGRMLDLAERLLAGHEPRPSLLHGDLWSGNLAALEDASAVVFDPAPYYGDPETDLAMLQSFGGSLPASFLEAYGPLPPGHEQRRPLYDLYHALNHMNLFGDSYSWMVERCVAEMAWLSAKAR